VLNLPDGKRFTISTEGLADENLYIQSVTLNGVPLTRTWIGHDEIVAGGELHFVMGAEANTTWGAPAAARPYSVSAYPDYAQSDEALCRGRGVAMFHPPFTEQATGRAHEPRFAGCSPVH